MTSFDNPGLFYQQRFFATGDEDGPPDEGRELIIEHKQTVDLFREFLREYNHYVEVSLDDLKGFNEEIANKMQQYPTRILAAVNF
ncbi:unnamed protein product [Gongylonema pulchrum]|uniref:MCM_N domain-containing protein n=1 Tax=Gongylonema pulchrum TaxID=637853 RepID=A0A183DXA4_9BILA|nr:unnamed protein product [Gongylonema pulchrum]